LANLFDITFRRFEAALFAGKENAIACAFVEVPDPDAFRDLRVARWSHNRRGVTFNQRRHLAF
jgi:hypothetical protein